ncbi:MAG: ABC transporter permease, partial [Pseudomonadota bacterium]
MADLATSDDRVIDDREAKRRARRMRRFDNPWLAPKLLWGVGILLGIIVLGLIGQIIWNPELVYTGAGPLKLPPLGFENLRGQPGVGDHPLGTDGAGRDMLALLVIGAPNSLMVGV